MFWVIPGHFIVDMDESGNSKNTDKQNFIDQKP